MFQRITSEDIQTSLRAVAAGEKPAIDAGLLARFVPAFSDFDDSMPSPACIEYIGLQWRFHSDAIVSWGVLGRDGNFVMIPLAPGEWEAAQNQRDAAKAAGYWYCGNVGLTADLTPLVLTEPEPTSDCLAILLNACITGLWPEAQARAARGTTAAQAATAGDSAAWLAGLYELPDAREQVTGGLPN